MHYLKFKDYIVNEMRFKRIKEYPVTGPVLIDPRIDLAIMQANVAYKLTISVHIDEKQANNSTSPFELNLNVTANFDVIEMANAITLRDEATYFIYPYVRAIISSMTASANVVPYMMPVLDLSQNVRGANAPNQNPVDKKRDPLDGTNIRPIDEII
ncbi:MAG: protein-export chaperone SecB [Endomicrobium sp.]|jgi:preprotein translocase subunit SecB|nr:protein-export chaperone SecB [Endomicrobium sp.]